MSHRRYLLDTNVLSELIRKRPDPSVLAHLRQLRGSRLMTSAICVTELRYGAARHPDRERLWQRIQNEILKLVDVLPLGIEEASLAGDILAELEKTGQPIGTEDVLIGATALGSELTLVTRNIRHFSRIEGLIVESWWEEI